MLPTSTTGPLYPSQTRLPRWTQHTNTRSTTLGNGNGHGVTFTTNNPAQPNALSVFSPVAAARTWRQGIFHHRHQLHEQSYTWASEDAPHRRFTPTALSLFCSGYTLYPPCPVGLTEKLSRTIKIEEKHEWGPRTRQEGFASDGRGGYMSTLQVNGGLYRSTTQSPKTT